MASPRSGPSGAIPRPGFTGTFATGSWSIRGEWTWRVDRLQRTADIRVKAGDGYAAALFLIFGRPSMLNRDVPTLAYVWTSARIAEDSIVDSPYHPGTTRNVVARSGEKRLGQWVTERRNVISDFRRAFGREPPETVELVALFTDNDQTREPVEAYYGAVRALPRWNPTLGHE